MLNLAGDKNADAAFREELERCGIPVVDLPGETTGEVKVRSEGRIGPFAVGRAWRYATVTGPMPLKVARELCEHPVGRRDVRVAGHCACPPPGEWVTHRCKKTGKEIVGTDQRAELDDMHSRHPKMRAQFERECVYGDPADGEAFVESYHIDSEAGLSLFAETVRRHGLDVAPQKAGSAGR